MTDPHRDRIASLVAGEGYLTDKDGVLDVLARGGSFDVQACPGSGKTTTVAAKIVVLLDDWSSRGGICVLTHTNVAREEIQKKLRSSTIGRAALDSPHFIGTIQKFVDTFLAIPYLRATGATIEQIDNDAFESAVEDEYRRGSYYNFAGWLKRNTAAGQPENTRYRLLEYASQSDDLTFDGKPTGLKDPSTKSHGEMARLKETLSARGIYRHGDMYHFANRYLDQFPWAVNVLRRRFPVVIIDEMQDTSARQDALLTRIFPADEMTVQRFGDDNQKIFDMDNDGDETSFPRDPVLPLGESRRFGAFIAENLSTIAPRIQTVLGETTIAECRHTIFLFDERTATDVIPRFATLAAEELKDLDGPPIVKAIGHRKQVASGKFPNYLGDYVAGFVPDTAASVTGPEGLRLRVERARVAMRTDPFSGPAQVLTAVRMLIRRWSDAEAPQRTLRRILDSRSLRRRVGAIVQVLLAAEIPEASAWDELVQPLLAVIAEVTGREPPEAAKAFAAWAEMTAPPLRSSPNAAACSVAVALQTIHSVKGENHDATLVLETYYYEHDVSRILPWLADPGKERKELLTRAKMDHRRMFVAMSRPRKLLCLAAAAARVAEPLRSALRAQHWHIVDLTKPNDE